MRTSVHACVRDVFAIYDNNILPRLIIMAITQFRLNLERVSVRFYDSINPIESVKLPSRNYLDESKMATSNMAVSKMASFCCVASKHRFVPAVTFDHYIGRQHR